MRFPLHDRGGVEKVMKNFVSLQPRNFRAWFMMAFQAGAINAGAFIACGRFVTHTTGFATHFSFDLIQGHFKEAFGMLTVPIFFLFGGMATSYFVDFPISEGKEPNYTVPTACIFLSLFAALVLALFGFFGAFSEPLHIAKDYLLLVLLCFASGLQNALTSDGKSAVVRTTHLTGVTTDLALGIIRVLFMSNHDDRYHKESIANFVRVGIITFFVLGSILSSYLMLKFKYLGFILPVITSLYIFQHFYKRTHYQPHHHHKVSEHA